MLRLGVVWGILGGTFLEAVVLLLENGTQHNATLSAAHQHPESWSAAAGVVCDTAFVCVTVAGNTACVCMTMVCNTAFVCMTVVGNTACVCMTGG